MTVPQGALAGSEESANRAWIQTVRRISVACVLILEGALLCTLIVSPQEKARAVGFRPSFPPERYAT